MSVDNLTVRSTDAEIACLQHDIVGTVALSLAITYIFLYLLAPDVELAILALSH